MTIKVVDKIKKMHLNIKNSVQSKLRGSQKLNGFLNLYDRLTYYEDYRDYLIGLKCNNFIAVILLVSILFVPASGRMELMIFWIFGLILYLFRVQWVEFKGRSLLRGSKQLAKVFIEKGINMDGWRIVDRVNQNGDCVFEIVFIKPHSIIYDLSYKLRKGSTKRNRDNSQKRNFFNDLNNAFIARRELNSWDRHKINLSDISKAINLIKESGYASEFYVTLKDTSIFNQSIQNEMSKTLKLKPMIPGRLDYMAYKGELKAFFGLGTNNWKIYRLNI
ncbi:hypothetical protein [Lactiplantibacillus plantarum]|uniref:hypothetical protein n=1 Tax=Lactiplantibacillus plantarum TaxID=1590 RepID=UPI001BA8D2B4|nr:hypothetical protein [Lactiplantibacillus plantarum]MBS0954978.1 hypothetical protein [Lactiplantibacillus plantarum]